MNDKKYQFLTLLLVFLYFEILLPLSFHVLQLDGIIQYIASLAVVNGVMILLNTICNYFLPFFRKHYSSNALVASIIKIKKFGDDINPLQIIEHDSKKLKELLLGVSFLYVASAIFYVFICWFLKQLQGIITDIKIYTYARTATTTK